MLISQKIGIASVHDACKLNNKSAYSLDIYFSGNQAQQSTG